MKKIKVRITNCHFVQDEETPTLNQWCGIENGYEIDAEMNDKGRVWISAPREHYTEEFGFTPEGSESELVDGEFEVIE